MSTESECSHLLFWAARLTNTAAEMKRLLSELYSYAFSRHSDVR